MEVRSFPTRLKVTPQSAAVRYIRTIGKAVARYTKRADEIQKEIEIHESKIEELKEKRQKAKPRITALARQFLMFAERHRRELIPGKLKSAQTEAGRFGWFNNPEGLVYPDEQTAIKELIRLKRFDLLRMEIKKTETKAAIKCGSLKSSLLSIGCRERFVITANNLPAVTVYGDDPVRIGKEELEG